VNYFLVRANRLVSCVIRLSTAYQAVGDEPRVDSPTFGEERGLTTARIPSPCVVPSIPYPSWLRPLIWLWWRSKWGLATFSVAERFLVCASESVVPRPAWFSRLDWIMSKNDIKRHRLIPSALVRGSGNRCILLGTLDEDASCCGVVGGSVRGPLPILWRHRFVFSGRAL